MNKIAEALKKTGVFFVATADADGQPRVRPFGAVAEFEGKVYLCTNNQKQCFAQMLADPRTEISGMYPDGGTWLRVTGRLVLDDRDAARAAMLEQNPDLNNMFSVGDGLMEVLYLEDVICMQYSFTADPVEIR